MLGTDEKTCLFVGPDRAGKTWFIGGTAYSLEAAAIDSEENQTTNPKLNQPLKQLSNIFKIEDFDQQLPTVHNPDEFDFLQFNLNQQGLIRQQQTTVNTVDYAGEHITNIITEPERAYDRFRREWDFETVPSFEKLMERDSSGDIDAHQIPVLLSVLAHEADLLALVLPMDDFAEGLSKEELPAHLDQDQLETRRTDRIVPRIDKYNEGYLQLYADLCENNDFIFLATMSDVFLQTYRETESEPESPLRSWESFREHVWEHIQNMSDPFEPGRHIDMDSHKHLYPVYFEPDPDDPLTSHGEFKPKLDWNDDHYPLRGLQYVLERIR